MAGNKNLDVTAEAVATIRSSYGMPFHNHFETVRGKVLIGIARLAMPKRILDERMELSYAMEEVLRRYNPDQVVELAGGASLYGLEQTLEHPDMVYVETDMPNVAEWKKARLGEIRDKECLPVPKNHHVLPLDVVCNDIYDTVHQYLDPSKKTLVIAEALPLFLDEEQHNIFLQSLLGFMNKYPNTVYASHDFNIESLGSGMLGKLFVSLVKRRLDFRIHSHFAGLTGSEFFVAKGLDNYQSLSDALGDGATEAERSASVREKYPNLSKPVPLFPFFLVGK